MCFVDDLHQGNACKDEDSAIITRADRTVMMIVYVQQSTAGYSINILLIHPLTAKLSDRNFHPLEVVSPYRDTQLQVNKDYSYLFTLRSNIRCKGYDLLTHIIVTYIWPPSAILNL